MSTAVSHRRVAKDRIGNRAFARKDPRAMAARLTRPTRRHGAAAWPTAISRVDRCAITPSRN